VTINHTGRDGKYRDIFEKIENIENVEKYPIFLYISDIYHGTVKDSQSTYYTLFDCWNCFCIALCTCVAICSRRMIGTKVSLSKLASIMTALLLHNLSCLFIMNFDNNNT